VPGIPIPHPVRAADVQMSIGLSEQIDARLTCPDFSDHR
jgi:hypothetical protein